MQQMTLAAPERVARGTPYGPERVLLRPYQEAALTAIDKAETEGNRKQMLVLPTGAGKTIVFASLINRRGARALVLAHRDELIQQAVDKIHAVVPRAQVGIVKATKDDAWAPIVVASIQTLANENRRTRLAAQSWDLVVCDEAHHSAAQSYRNVYEALRCGEPGGPLLVGVTATPDRGDRVRLDDVFDGIVYRVGLLDLINQGYLCDVRAVRVSIDLDLDGLRKSGGDYHQGDLEDALENADQPAQTALAVKEHARDRRSIVFTASVALAQETAAELASLDIAAEYVSGEMPMIDRRAVLARFQSGQTQVVVNCMVLTEGFDCPEADCVVIARPTQSRPLYQQCVGRGLRTAPGKQDCLVIDVVGVTLRHDLQTAASLTGVDFARRGGSDLTMTEAIRQMGGLVEDPVTGQMVSIPVELFGRSRFAWVRPPNTTAWTLPFDRESTLAITPSAVVDQAVDGAMVQGIAEELVRRDGDKRLTDREASWRISQEPSEKQINFARTLRIDLNALADANGGFLTKGMVSDAITAARMTGAINRWTQARKDRRAA
jgi:superfamily II DNA or RNA helicase